MQKPFLRVLAPDEAREMLTIFQSLDTETVDLDNASARVLSEPIVAAEDLPGFNRSTMDGFAVRSGDTFGASESAPGFFRLVGEVAMGAIPDVPLRRGEAVRIWTGGALPENADAVVMVEHTDQLDDMTVELYKAVAPFENVVRRGEDCLAGETLLDAGHRIRTQDIGLFAALGKAVIPVFRTPRVALVSSGDEIVPVDQEPRAGCMRDVNRHTLHASIREAHAIPLWIGTAEDRLESITALLCAGMDQADVVVISGGSSMGNRDLVIEAIRRQPDSEVLLHGVSIAPGKPLIIARVGKKPVLGLPGHPVSALVCFDQFVVPILRRLEGEDVATPYRRPMVQAVLGRNVPSREGRVDYVRVRLERSDGLLSAIPVPGKSGMISAMVRADGFIVIEQHSEGLYRGDPVAVHLFGTFREENREKEHLSGHEAAGGGARPVSGASRHELLSGR
jgi:molybdopterin molybdotransferase